MQLRRVSSTSIAAHGGRPRLRSSGILLARRLRRHSCKHSRICKLSGFLPELLRAVVPQYAYRFRRILLSLHWRRRRPIYRLEGRVVVSRWLRRRAHVTPQGRERDGSARGCDVRHVMLVSRSCLRGPINASSGCEIWRLSGASLTCWRASLPPSRERPSEGVHCGQQGVQV